MTNATVKPALNRIEKKLDEVKEMMETNSAKESNDDGSKSSNENENSSIEMTCCENTKKEME